MKEMGCQQRETGREGVGRNEWRETDKQERSERGRQGRKANLQAAGIHTCILACRHAIINARHASKLAVRHEGRQMEGWGDSSVG